MKLRTLVVLTGLGAHAARQLRVEAGDGRSSTSTSPAPVAPDPQVEAPSAPEQAADGVPAEPAAETAAPAPPPEIELEAAEPTFPTLIEPEPEPEPEREPGFGHEGEPQPAAEHTASEPDEPREAEAAGPEGTPHWASGEAGAPGTTIEAQPEAAAEPSGGPAPADAEPGFAHEGVWERVELEAEPPSEPEPGMEPRPDDGGEALDPLADILVQQPVELAGADDRPWPYTLLPEADEAAAGAGGAEEAQASSASSDDAQAASATAPVEETAARDDGDQDDDGMPDGWTVVVYPDEREEAPAPQPAARPSEVVLHDLEEIRSFLRTSETPVALVAPTPFALLGCERWIPRLSAVVRYDSFDGRYPGIFVPPGIDPDPPVSAAAVCNDLLRNPQVAAHLRERAEGRLVVLAGDAQTDALVEDLGSRLAGPDARLRKRLESRIESTRLAADAGVPCVPNVLGHAASWKELLLLARAKNLGEDLVVQTPYRDGERSTFPIAGARDWEEHEDRLVGEQLKVMRRISPVEVAVAGVVTRFGPLLAPGVTQVTAFPHVVPYAGGWCLAEPEPGLLSDEQRERARRYARLLGERLRREGFLGAYEVEIVVDEDTEDVYLAGLVPGLGAAAAAANVTAAANGEMPVQLFHLLEYMDVEYEIDLEELEEAMATAEEGDRWSVFVLQDTADLVELITEAPSSGIWRFEESAQGGIEFVRAEPGWRSVAGEEEAFYLRVSAAGQYRRAGAPLGVLVVRGDLLDEERRLDERALRWIRGLKKNFWTAPAPPGAPEPEPAPFRFTLR